jgi:hypothetical protein
LLHSSLFTNQKYIPAVLAVGTFRSCDNKQFVKYKKDVHQVVWQHEFANHDKIPFFSLSPTILLRKLIIVIRPVSNKKQELLYFSQASGLITCMLMFSCHSSFNFSLLWDFLFCFRSVSCCHPLWIVHYCHYWLFLRLSLTFIINYIEFQF